VTPNDQREFIGQFKLDPKDGEFQALRSVCEPGNPWRCLIATSASIHLGKRMTVRVDHENNTGVIGITEGDLRWERPMTKEELTFATRFDLGEELPKPLTVKVDLRDPAWAAKPKRGADGVRPGGPRSKIRNGNAEPHTKSIRARQLAAIRAAYAPEGTDQ
jgi:hypothetical protein